MEIPKEIFVDVKGDQKWTNTSTPAKRSIRYIRADVPDPVSAQREPLIKNK